MFSGLFFGSLYMIPQQGTLCWALALMISYRALTDRPTVGRFLACAGSLSLAAVSGAPEVFAFGAMTTGLIIFLERPFEVRRWPRITLLYVLPMATGVLACLPFFLAAMENAHFSLRGALMPFAIKIETLAPQWPAIIPTWLFPFKYYTDKMGVLQNFNHGLSPLFQGALVAPTLLIALVRARKDRTSSGLALTWIVLLLFIVLSEAPVTRDLFDRIPMLGMLKVPAKAVCYLEVVTLLMVLLLLRAAASAEGRGLRLALSATLILCGLAIVAAQPWCLGGGERYVLGAVDLGLGAAFAWGTIRGRPAFSGRRLSTAFAVMMAVEVLLMAARSVPGTDPELYRLPADLRRQNLDLSDGTRFAVFEQLLPTTTEDPPPLFGLFGVSSQGCNFTGPSRVYPAWSFLYQSLINRGLIETAPGADKYLGVYSLANPGMIRRDRMHLFNLAGVRLILSRDLAVPFTSPYSLLKPNALSLSSGAGLIELAGSPPALTLIGPSRLEAGLASMAGDRLVMEGRAQAPGTIFVRARMESGRDEELLLAQAVTPGQNLSVAVSLDVLRTGGDLSLAWEPRNNDDPRIDFHRLEIENPARPFQRFFESKGIELFTNRDALPRAFVVHESRVVSGLSAAMKEIADPVKFSPGREVVLDSPFPGEASPPIGPAGSSDQVAITSYGSERVEMTSSSRSPGFLVFTDTYFPGWKAWINQGGVWKETRIARADLAFRAIRLPAGSTESAGPTSQPRSASASGPD